MPIGKVELPVIASSIASDEESISESVKGEEVQLDEEPKFLPSRLVDKQGRLNIRTKELDIRNPFTFRNALTLRWGHVILIYITGFIMSWLAFALIYILIQKYYESTCNSLECMTDVTDNSTVCVSGIGKFAGAVLYSLEVQSTIGYGSRALQTSGCSLHVLAYIIQSWFGLILVTITTGILLFKYTNPGSTTKFLRFSENAVVFIKDKSVYLSIRVGQVSKSRIVGTTVSALMFAKETTIEGEEILANPSSIKLTSDYVPLLWPNCVTHKIDKSSPLFNVSPNNLKNITLEIVFWLSGKRERTGISAEACTSYTAQEIVWGAEFSQNVDEDKTNLTDDDLINYYKKVDMPKMSAAEMEKQGLITL